ncbi:MAG: HNH endonuclease [Rickettsiales bacterium]|jgi:hypothetical protein|nr:HNH endonuclease [Rickettsiales bacterium]
MNDTQWRRTILALIKDGTLHCITCGAALDRRFTKDHMIPIAHSKDVKNDDYNWIPMCPQCNQEKGDLPFWKFWLAKELVRKR